VVQVVAVAQIIAQQMLVEQVILHLLHQVREVLVALAVMEVILALVEVVAAQAQLVLV
jgi:hypothetical protein